MSKTVAAIEDQHIRRLDAELLFILRRAIVDGDSKPLFVRAFIDLVGLRAFISTQDFQSDDSLAPTVTAAAHDDP